MFWIKSIMGIFIALQKGALLAIFQKGWDGRALLVQPSRIPCWISKNIFVLGSYEFLVMLEGKFRNDPCF